MADATLDQYQPNRTLGRSGYVSVDADTICHRIEQLDALLCLISLAPEGDEPEGFFSCNEKIQASVLRLASSLATEIHELHEKLLLQKLATH